MVDFKKLSDFVEGRTGYFITVRATQVWLEKKPDTLYALLKEDSEIMTDSEERKRHFDSADSEWFEKDRLERWDNSSFPMINVAGENHPLEVVTGDVCPILEIEEKEYILSFFRNIPPIGWLIPGGCPKNLEELLSPSTIAERELCEEVIIGDIDNNFYSVCVSETELIENLHFWGIEPKEIIPVESRQVSFKKGQAQRLVLEMENNEMKITEDVAVDVDTQNATISVTLYRKIMLPLKLSSLRLFDGEKKKDGSLLNRPVRLTEVGSGKVVAIFVSGQNILSSGWHSQRMKELAEI